MYAIIIQDSKKLFIYPCLWHMVCKRLTDEDGKIREEIQQQWRVFAACKPKKRFAFEEDTPLLVQVLTECNCPPLLIVWCELDHTGSQILY
jgi:hypothetical protein